MPNRKFRFVFFGLFLYLALCVVGGIWIADGTLRPPRRPLPDDALKSAGLGAYADDADLRDVSIAASDGVTLRGWLIRPHHPRGDDVILLHGLGDNRLGMIGYAQLLLAHGYTILMPDARAHGSSGGALATFGLLERNDIRQWFDFVAAQDHPRCIFGLGESMGAAQLLQSLDAGAPFCAVAAESSFSNFREIAYDRMGQPFHLGPWFGRTFLRPLVEVAFLRARWKYKLNLQEVSPEDAVAKTRVPVLLIHGQRDSNIPVRHSRRIHARNPAAILWEVDNADHCGAISASPKEFQQRVLAWFATDRSPHTLRLNRRLTTDGWPLATVSAFPVHVLWRFFQLPTAK